MLVIVFHYQLLLFLHYFFFFNDTATTEIYTLSLHDALPISAAVARLGPGLAQPDWAGRHPRRLRTHRRSEEHTSELQSRPHLVCRLLLEKKKKNSKYIVQLKKKRTQEN